MLPTLLRPSTFLLLGGLCAGTAGAQVDLSLTAKQSIASPVQYKTYTVTVAVANDGPQAATGVAIALPVPTGTVYVGDDEGEATQGTFDTYRHRWLPGTLAPGARAELTINYYALAADASAQYAQVAACDQPDADSTPGNGTVGEPREDDEASSRGGGEAPDERTLPDLRWEFTTGPTDALVPGQTVEGAYTLRNGGATATGAFYAEAYVSLDARLDAADTLIQRVRVADLAPGAGIGNSGAGLVPDLAPGTYHLLAIADVGGVVAESDERNNVVAVPFTIVGDDGSDDDGSDDDGGDDDGGDEGGDEKAPQGVDLELTATSASPQPARYTANAVTVTVRNTGAAPATGVRVVAPAPNGTVFVGDDEYTATQGTFFAYDGAAWKVGTLAPGASATLTVNLYTLAPDGYRFYAQVAALDQVDVDSSPGNGTAPSASEDDEVALDLRSTTSSRLAERSLAAYPNPVAGGHALTLRVPVALEAPATVVVYDAFGREVRRQVTPASEDPSAVAVSVDGLPTGSYTVRVLGTRLRPRSFSVQE